MKTAKQRDRLNKNNLLRIRADTELPSHKVAVSIDDLAEKWDVTVATIRNRIKRLKASGVMDVILVMNPYKIGFNTFAIIGIRLETGANPDNIVSNLLSIPGVTNVVMVAGRYDFFLHYVCQNMKEYRQFVAEQLRMIPGIANVESFIGLDLYERKFELGVIS